HPDMIRRQMEIITSAQVEIVITAHQEINERQLPTDVYVEDAIELLDRKEVIRRLIEDQDIQSYFWGKLYKAEIIKKLRFPEDYTYEDTAMLAEILMSTDCIAYSKSVYYFYYMNPNSILHSRDLRLNLQQLRAYEKQMQDIVTVYPEFQAMLELRHFRLELSTYCYYLKQYVGDAQYTVALQKVWREMSARKKSMAKAQIKLLPAEHLRFLRCRMQRILRHVS
ncbi:MAG: hypothetical protein K6G23_06110, partial [Lachnospiraceae bacterium]|nr:hypothetical protein [Lachnospiraceae bacterium]